MQAWRRRSSGWLVSYPGIAATLVLWVLVHSAAGAAQGSSRFDISLGTDYRHAQLDWNIAGTFAGSGPNILSELTWHDLDIAQVSGAK